MVETDLPTLGTVGPRVALFTDTFYEANGVGTLTRQLAAFAQERTLPLMVIRGGDCTELSEEGSLQTLQLRRGAASFPVDKTLYFDPLLMRHRDRVLRAVQAFKPDLIHVTGPGDIGFLGVWVAHVLGIASVASWHTNLHEYLSRRLQRVSNVLPAKLGEKTCQFVEQQTLRGLMRFYRTARFALAPNQAMVDLIKARTGRPAYLMGHGVDLASYQVRTPKTDYPSRPFCIGYVGRLTTEKNVQRFVEIEQKLLAAGEINFRWLLVGEGGQEKWLRTHLKRADMAGVLRGAALSEAYRRMDVFVFPSRTDTFGLVILEAMASGVPVILAPETGLRVGVEDGISGLLTDDLCGAVCQLMNNSEARSAMGKAARDFANTQGWDMVFTHLYETYAAGLDMEKRKGLRKADKPLAV